MSGPTTRVTVHVDKVVDADEITISSMVDMVKISFGTGADFIATGSEADAEVERLLNRLRLQHAEQVARREAK